MPVPVAERGTAASAFRRQVHFRLSDNLPECAEIMHAVVDDKVDFALAQSIFECDPERARKGSAISVGRYKDFHVEIDVSAAKGWIDSGSKQTDALPYNAGLRRSFFHGFADTCFLLRSETKLGKGHDGILVRL
jgi:hypothetical protein